MFNDHPLEDQLLGGLLHLAENAEPYAEDSVALLDVSAFRIPANRLIYAALRDLLFTLSSADVMATAKHLRSKKQLWDAGGYVRFTYLWSAACPPQDLPELLELFVNRG